MNTARRSVLLVRAGGWACALPLPCIVETMRCLPLQSLAGMPAYVLGASLIRGAATPVVALAGLLEGKIARQPARLVLVRGQERVVALAVEAVMGVKELSESDSQALPPLMSELARDHVESLYRLDGELVALLTSTRLMPQGAEQALLGIGG